MIANLTEKTKKALQRPNNHYPYQYHRPRSKSTARFIDSSDSDFWTSRNSKFDPTMEHQVSELDEIRNVHNVQQIPNQTMQIVTTKNKTPQNNNRNLVSLQPEIYNPANHQMSVISHQPMTLSSTNVRNNNNARENSNDACSSLSSFGQALKISGYRSVFYILRLPFFIFPFPSPLVFFKFLIIIRSEQNTLFMLSHGARFTSQRWTVSCHFCHQKIEYCVHSSHIFIVVVGFNILRYFLLGQQLLPKLNKYIETFLSYGWPKTK